MDRTWVLAGIVISLVSLALGVWKQDGMMMTMSAAAVFFSVLSFMYCSDRVHIYAFIMSVSVLICTALTVTVASHDSLVVSGTASTYTWIYITSIMRGIAVIPMIMMFFFVTAAVFKASYNWATASVMSWAIGMGLLLPMYVTVLFVQRADLYDGMNDGIIANATLVIGMLVNLLIFITFSMILRSVMKKNKYLITENGLEEMK